MTEEHRPGGPRPGPSGPHGGGGPGSPEPLSAEERAVRELLRRSVADLQPDGAALARIRSGVPRRRAVRRGAWTGAAAVVFAAAVALPALRIPEQLGLSGPAAATTADSAAATGAAHTDGGGGATGHLPLPYSGSGPGATPSSSVTTAETTAASSAVSSVPPAVSSAGPGTAVAVVPDCARTDLGQGTSQVGPPDAAGAVYGSFFLVNISGHSCTAAGAGTMAVSAATVGDPAHVRVADHLAGDAATALPEPAGIAAAGPPVLAPGEAYRVLFGWVPGAGCRRSSAAPTASPTAQAATAQPSPAAVAAPAAAGSSTGAATAPAASAAPSAGGAPGAEAASPSPTATATGAPSPTASPTALPSDPAPSLTLAYTPAPAGSAAVTAVVGGACGGTVYRTAPQAAPVQPSGASAAG